MTDQEFVRWWYISGRKQQVEERAETCQQAPSINWIMHFENEQNVVCKRYEVKKTFLKDKAAHWSMVWFFCTTLSSSYLVNFCQKLKKSFIGIYRWKEIDRYLDKLIDKWLISGVSWNLKYLVLPSKLFFGKSLLFILGGG